MRRTRRREPDPRHRHDIRGPTLVSAPEESRLRPYWMLPHSAQLSNLHADGEHPPPGAPSAGNSRTCAPWAVHPMGGGRARTGSLAGPVGSLGSRERPQRPRRHPFRPQSARGPRRPSLVALNCSHAIPTSQLAHLRGRGARARESLQLADEVGLALRADRQRLGLSQRAYAARRGWTLATVIRLESAAGAMKLGDVDAALAATPFQLCLCHRPPTDELGAAQTALEPSGRPSPRPRPRRPAPASPRERDPASTPARARLPPPSRPLRSPCTRPSGRGPSSSPGCAVEPALPGPPRHRAGRVRPAVVVVRRGVAVQAACRPTGTPRSTPAAAPRRRDPARSEPRCRRAPAR